MKKVSIIVLVIVLLLTFAACKPSNEPFHYDYDELKESVTRVELIYYNNQALFYHRHRDQLLPFDFSKVEVLKTLPESKLDDFLHDLSEYTFIKSLGHLDSPQGYSVRLLYSNGDFEIISQYFDYSGSFYADGQVKRFIGTGLDSSYFHKYFD